MAGIKPTSQNDSFYKELLSDAISQSQEDFMAGWQPPSPAALAKLLEGYSVSNLLGRGGMSAVYLATQNEPHRKVVIKLIPAEMSDDLEFAGRFRREAKSMAKLNHDNIVQLFDSGTTEEGHHYIVMEYVDGADLQQHLKSEQLGTKESLSIVEQVCEALDFAHGLGFIHRDIKPANIFIDRSGTVKVGDFGLAKLLISENEEVTEGQNLTASGFSLGTPHYMAPESQVGQGAIDHRADIYSLGIVLYQLLTGELPRGQFKLPSQMDASLGKEIDQVVLKATHEDPSHRYQSGQEFRTDLGAILAFLPEKKTAKPSQTWWGFLKRWVRPFNRVH